MLSSKLQSRLVLVILVLVALTHSTAAWASEDAPTGEGDVQWIYGAPSDSATPLPRPSNGSQPSLKKVGGSLAIVLGGFFLLTVFLRKKTTALPAHEMIEPLGSVPITPKVRLHLVRFGSRILVLHISGQNVQRVAELEDPVEVQKLLGLCQGGSSNSVPVSVNDLLQTMESDVGLPWRGQLQ